MGNLGKIKGFMLAAAVLAAAALGWYAAAWPEQELVEADEGIPVYINGPFVEAGAWRGSAVNYERIATAELAGGHTYVPLRAVFEACEVEVSWNGQEKLIEAELGADRSLRMTVGSQLAYIGEQQVELEAAPFARDGVVYVPLRFVGEALGCGVDWRSNGQGPGFGGNAAKGVTGQVVYLTRNLNVGNVGRSGTTWRIDRQAGSAMEYVWGDKVWRLDFNSGLLTLQGKDGGEPRELGQLDLSLLTELGVDSSTSYGLYVRETPKGNWQALVDVGIWDDTGHIPGNWHFYAWLAPELGKSYNASFYSASVEDRMEPLWISGDGGRGEIFLPGEGYALIIDDGTGELVQRLEGRILRWADAGHVLFGYGAQWELIDRQTGERRDLLKELLTEERKARMEAQLQECLPDFAEKNRELFWEAIGDEQINAPRAQLFFEGEEAGKLKFRLMAYNLPSDCYGKVNDISMNIEL